MPLWVSHWVTASFNNSDSFRNKISLLCSVFKKGSFTRECPTCNCLHFERRYLVDGVRLSLKKFWTILQLSIYVAKNHLSCYICSVTVTQYVQNCIQKQQHGSVCRDENTILHCQACVSPLSAHSCCHLSFPISGSQAQASIVPHFLYMVFSSATAPARQRKTSLAH